MTACVSRVPTPCKLLHFVGLCRRVRIVEEKDIRRERKQSRKAKNEPREPARAFVERSF